MPRDASRCIFIVMALVTLRLWELAHPRAAACHAGRAGGVLLPDV